MSAFKILLAVLIGLLIIIVGLAVSPQVPMATGMPHPEFGTNILIAPNNIDQESHTRWMGYLYGLGIIGVFWTFITIGTRKKGKKTVMFRWVAACFIIYIIVYTMMTRSHWSYTEHNGSDFIFSMPAPTAWMIYGMWFIPIIITLAFVVFFEKAVISDEEITEFEIFIQSRTDS